MTCSTLVSRIIEIVQTHLVVPKWKNIVSELDYEQALLVHYQKISYTAHSSWAPGGEKGYMLSCKNDREKPRPLRIWNLQSEDFLV